MERHYKTIDAILSTHRELLGIDEINHRVTKISKGGFNLKIMHSEKEYSYDILSSGEIKAFRISEDGIRFINTPYFNHKTS